jgi:hypothetical protein
VFANHLLGEGRGEDAAVFARVAVGLEDLRAKADARLNDLIARQLNPEAEDKPMEIPAAKPFEGTPEERLVQFMATHHDTTYADIKYSANVHTADFQDWRNGRLSPTSVMTKRIEDVLSERTPLQKKPPKPRPD